MGDHAALDGVDTWRMILAINNLLPFLFALCIPVTLGSISFAFAAHKGRNRWLWGLIGFIAPLAALLVVLLPKVEEEPVS